MYFLLHFNSNYLCQSYGIDIIKIYSDLHNIEFGLIRLWKHTVNKLIKRREPVADNEIHVSVYRFREKAHYCVPSR